MLYFWATMALVYQKELHGLATLAIWKIEESADELIAQLQLDEQEQAYFESLIQHKRQLHWLATRVLLRTLLKTEHYIDCKADAHGKPYLVNFPHHISLSHSYDYAAVMISETRAVGIDIELVKPKIEALAPKFLTEAERSFIDPNHTVAHLYSCWAAKEAVYKLQGKNGVSFKEHIRLQAFAYAEKGVIQASLKNNAAIIDFEVSFERFGSYVLAYVCGEEEAHAE
jgi:phosphopantetheine--protein transferase-like protein